jgi:hypothetical protein
MSWPPTDLLTWKMAEHSAWFSGDAEILANFYFQYMSNNILNVPHPLRDDDLFWARQIINQGEIKVHVPLAGDIADTSANFLFGESPSVKIAEAHQTKAQQSFKDTQKDLDDMLLENMFYSRILEGAEACAGIGGVYIKIGWDKDVLGYPIPVVYKQIGPFLNLSLVL